MLGSQIASNARRGGAHRPLHRLAILLLVAILAAPVAAQEANDDLTALAATLGLTGDQLDSAIPDLFDELLGQAPSPTEAKGAIDQKRAEVAAAAPVLKGAAKATTAIRTVKATTTTAPGDTFADRVSGNLEDFLPLLQFAVQGVSTSDDGESMVIKFNPLKTEYGALAVKATIGQPEISPQLLAAIVEPAREAQEKALLSQVDDFGDVLVTGAYGYHRSDRGERSDWAKKGRLWGREPSLYSLLTEDLMEALLHAPIDQTESALNSAGKSQRKARKTLFSQLMSDVPKSQHPAKEASMTPRQLVAMAADSSSVEPADLAPYFDALRAHAEALGSLDSKLAAPPQLDDVRFSDLVSNQPQLVASFSLRARNRLVGPDSFSGSIQWEMGTRNLNSVRKEYRQLAAERQIAAGRALTDVEKRQAQVDALSTVTAGDNYRNQSRFIFSATWEQKDDYSLSLPYQQVVTDPATGTERTLDREAKVAIEGNEEITARLQWTRLVSFQGATGDDPSAPRPRFTFTVEYNDTDAPAMASAMGDMAAGMPPVRDRLVANVEYALPMPGGATLPITLTYANHARFLGDQDDQLSAHVGLSYKLGGIKEAVAGMSGDS